MILLHNGTIVTSAKEERGSILIEGDKISNIFFCGKDGIVDLPNKLGGETIDFDHLADKLNAQDVEVVSIEGKYVMAGGVDAHVHFRDPGLTHKADMFTESRAAAAGGVTTVMDMPNTAPATTNAETLYEKQKNADKNSVVNVMLHLGATNSNIDEIRNLTNQKPESFAGIKVFMGSSTGNMLVDREETLEKLFGIKQKQILVHCEDEQMIKDALQQAKDKYGEDIPFEEHENIRSRKACIKSSIHALELAIKNKTRLTLCHISTKEEVEMVRAAKNLNPAICAETSCNYLWFSNKDYKRLGSRLKCNPSVKTEEDKLALRDALRNGIIDSIGSDHAPHLETEKDGVYTKVPSGIPSIQYALPVLITVADQEGIPLSVIASVFSEKAAKTYGLNRGILAEGMYADIVVFDPHKEFTVRKEDILSKCGWSPYEGETLKGVVERVIVNGKTIIKNNKFTI